MLSLSGICSGGERDNRGADERNERQGIETGSASAMSNRAILTPAQVLAIRSAIQSRQLLKQKRMREASGLPSKKAAMINRLSGINDQIYRLSNPSLAAQYSVSRWTIASIACGKNWKNL